MAGAGSQVRVFISSPGDVAQERDKARQVLEGLQRLYPGVSLVPVLWEELALPVTASFQEAIDLVLHKQPIDIAVFILWSRLGSPLGKSIVKRDGSSYRSGTEREFDLMLAAYEASRAEGDRPRPVILAYGRDDEKGFRQKLASSPKDQLEELVEQRGLVEAFVREQFQDGEGHNLRALHSYPDPVSFAQRLHTHLRNALDDLLAAEAPRWPDNPYRGLQCFDLAHAAIFQGRDEETCDLLQRLRERAATGCGSVVIVGASGSGKSSLARAGVAAALVQHSYEESGCWKILLFVPSLADHGAAVTDARDKGLDLRLSLVRQLAELVPGLSTGPIEELAADLAQSPEITIRRGIVPALDRAGEAEKEGPWRVLIVLDQMEELWTDRRITPEQREQFLQTLEALARSGRVALLATLRSDFYPAAQLSPTFLRLKEGCGHYDLLPPGAAALQRVIQEPARLAGVQFERDEATGRTLDQMLLEEATRSPGALPLLQYLLDELYQARDVQKRLLTFAAYKQLGGLEGALGQRVAAVFADCPPEAQAALPELFSRLVSIDVAGDQLPVRRRALLTDLRQTPARSILTDRLIAARFLTTDRQGEAAVASLTHEALLRCWEQLAQWIRVNRDPLRVRARIEQSQQRWQEAQCEPSLLLSAGLPLEEGRQLLSHAALLTPFTATYVKASIDHDNALRRGVRRTRRLVLAGLSLLTVAAVIAGTLAMFAKQEADKQRGEAIRQAGKSKAALSRANDADAEKQEQLRLASMADYASAVKAWQEDYEAREQGGWAESLPAISKWHEAVLLCSRALKHEPTNAHASHLLYTLLRLRGHSKSTLPLSDPLNFKVGVLRAIFNPDGTRVVTTGSDKTAQIWDAMSGELLSGPLDHEGEVHLASFSPDGTRVVTTSSDNTARIWDATSGKSVGIPLRHDDEILSATFSPDGARVATASRDKTARIWDATSGKPLGEPLSHEGIVHLASFSPDGAHFLTVSSDGTARIWEMPSGNSLGILLPNDDVVHSASFSPDGTRVVTAGRGKTARLWDASSGKSLGIPLQHDGIIHSATFSPDGTRVVTASDDKTARIWDATSGRLLGAPLRHKDEVHHALFSPDGALVVTNTNGFAISYPSITFKDATVQVWDVASGKRRGEPMLFQGMSCDTSFSPDGTRVIITSNHIINSDGGTMIKTGTARVWDLASDVPPNEPLRHEFGVNTSSFSADGSRIVTASDDKTARVWDVASGNPLGTPFRHEDSVDSACFNPDGTIIVTATMKTAQLWDVASGKHLGHPLLPEGGISNASFSRDGAYVLTTSTVPSSRGGTNQVTISTFGGARVWGAASGKPLGQPLHFEKRVNTVTFSANGTRVVVSSDKTARVWDVVSGKPLGDPLHHEGEIYSANFSPNGSSVVTASSDNTARIWDVVSSTPQGTPLRHDGIVHSASFSSDGAFVVTVSSDKTARIWEVSTGKPLGLPLRHGDLVYRANFSPDGTRIVTVSSDKTARIWDAVRGQPLGEPLHHEGLISNANFGPDGSILVTSAGNCARVWDLAPARTSVPPAVLAWARGIAGVRHREGKLEAMLNNDRQVLLSTALPSGPWAELKVWLESNGPQRKLTPRSKVTVREIAERERDFNSRESLESALQYDLTVPLARMMLGIRYFQDEVERATKPNAPPVDPAILARAAHWRRYDLDRLPPDPNLWDRAAKILRELPDSKVGVGPKPITCAEAAVQAEKRAAELRAKLQKP